MSRVRGFEVVSKKEDDGINLPKRATRYSAGYDFEASETVKIDSIWKQMVGFIDTVENKDGVGYDSIEKFINSELEELSLDKVIKKFNLRPTLVPTGIKSYMKDDEYLQLSNRSSGPLKRGLLMSNGVGNIDKDYFNNESNEGEIYFQFINMLPFDVTVNKGDRIGQGIFKQYLTSDDDKASGDRTGGHGSSDK